MALITLFACPCGNGERFFLYLPKQKIYGEEWQYADANEERDGEIESAKILARAAGCKFVDSRKVETLTCSACGANMNMADIVEDFKMRKNTIPSTLSDVKRLFGKRVVWQAICPGGGVGQLEDISNNDLNRMSPEEWSCEACLWRYNCPRPIDDYLDEELGCEYYLPDDEEIARLKDE
jgi:hypothetical protein